MNEDEVLSAAHNMLPSLWALDIMLLLKRDADRGRSTEQIVHETRSSVMVVEDALKALKDFGMIVSEGVLYRYCPADDSKREIADEVEKLYVIKPLTVIKAIVTAPYDKLRSFSDAFRLKE